MLVQTYRDFELLFTKRVVPEELRPFQVVVQVKTYDERFRKRLKNVLSDQRITYRQLSLFEKMFTFWSRLQYTFFVGEEKDQTWAEAIRNNQNVSFLKELVSEEGLVFDFKSEGKMDAFIAELGKVLTPSLNLRYDEFMELVQKEKEYEDMYSHQIGAGIQ